MSENPTAELQRTNARYEHMEELCFLTGTFLSLLMFMMMMMNIHF
jgi:hypothetical protein